MEPSALSRQCGSLVTFDRRQSGRRCGPRQRLGRLFCEVIEPSEQRSRSDASEQVTCFVGCCFGRGVPCEEQHHVHLTKGEIERRLERSPCPKRTFITRCGFFPPAVQRGKPCFGRVSHRRHQTP